MITVSLCMIVRDEEELLGRCLESAWRGVDEIIIVDTGSRDRTKEVAALYTDKIYDFAWIDDFSAARNFAFAQATGDYLLWLDADDVMESGDLDALLELKRGLSPEVFVVMMKYHASFDAKGCPLFTYYRERLLKNGVGFKWQGVIHEAITPYGKIIHSDIAVCHRPGPKKAEHALRNLRIFEKQLAEGRQLNPREQFYYARELYYHQRYAEAIQAFGGFLAVGQGWVENNIDACQIMAYCHYALGEETQALAALLRSLCYDAPRAELCCDIGKHFLERNRYREAIFWYETAASCPRKDDSGAFVRPDCYDYLPWLQLCVCHDRLGDHAKAAAYNERAAAVKPDSPAVQLNRAYFALKN